MSRRPVDLHFVHLRGRAQPIVQSSALTRKIGAAAEYTAPLICPGCLNSNSRADGVAMTASAPQPKLKPVTCGATADENRRRLCVVLDHEIEVAVVVEVGDSQTACVLDAVSSVDPSDVNELATVVTKESIVFVTVEGFVADVNERADIAVNYRTPTDVLQKSRSQIMTVFPRNEAVSCVEIEVAVVVVV